MNHKHRKILHSLFSHPIPSNIDRRDVEAVMRELGAEIDHSGHGRLQIKRGGHLATLHGSEHSWSKDEVAYVKKFVEAIGIDPARDYPV